MNGEGSTSRKQLQASTKSGSRVQWTLALAGLGLAYACAVVVSVSGLVGERGVIQGSGTVVAEDRPLGHVERVSLSDLGTLIIIQGDEDALTVETDDNLMRYVETRVRGGTLVLGLSDRVRRRAVRSSQGITYHLSVRHIAGLEVADSGRIQAADLNVGSLEISAHDSGEVTVDALMARTLRVYVEDSGAVHVTGQVERQEITVQDSGHYLADRLQSRSASVATSDSAEATLWATEVLDATVADSGRVRYYGDPRRTQRVSDRGALIGPGEP